MQKTSCFLPLMAALLFAAIPMPSLASAAPDATPSVMAPKPGDFLAPGEVLLPIPTAAFPQRTNPPAPVATATMSRPAAAHVVWQLLADREISALVVSLVALVLTLIVKTLSAYLGERTSQKTAKAAERAMMLAIVEVETSFTDLVRGLREQSPNGHLTVEQKNQVLKETAERAWQRIRSEGLDKALNITKDMMPVLVEHGVKYLQSRGRASKRGKLVEAIPDPFDGSVPLPSSVD